MRDKRIALRDLPRRDEYDENAFRAIGYMKQGTWFNKENNEDEAVVYCL